MSRLNIYCFLWSVKEAVGLTAWGWDRSINDRTVGLSFQIVSGMRWRERGRGSPYYSGLGDNYLKLIYMLVNYNYKCFLNKQRVVFLVEYQNVP
jgi:hypothetical protein